MLPLRLILPWLLLSKTQPCSDDLILNKDAVYEASLAAGMQASKHDTRQHVCTRDAYCIDNSCLLALLLPEELVPILARQPRPEGLRRHNPG